MSSITFSIDEFCHSNSYNQESIAIIHKYFGNRTTIEIPVIPIVLNYECGGFTLSEEAEALLANKLQQAQITKYKIDCGSYPSSIEFRTSQVLIDTIKKIGLKKSSTKFSCLYFANIPVKYIDCVYYEHYEGGCEKVKFNPDKAIRKLVLDETLSFEELKTRLTEIAFISIIFDKIPKYYD